MQFLKYKLYLPMDEIKFSCEKHFQRREGGGDIVKLSLLQDSYCPIYFINAR